MSDHSHKYLERAVTAEAALAEAQREIARLKDNAKLNEALRQGDEALLQLADCAPYLKDGETPAACIQRQRKDIDATLSLLAADRREIARLDAEAALWKARYDERHDAAESALAAQCQSIAALREWHEQQIKDYDESEAPPEYAHVHCVSLGKMDALGLLPAAPVGEKNTEPDDDDEKCHNCKKVLDNDAEWRMTDDDVTLCAECYEALFPSDAEPPREQA